MTSAEMMSQRPCFAAQWSAVCHVIKVCGGKDSDANWHMQIS